MPLFEFKCADCGHKFEELVMGSKAINCPECKSADVEKLLSTFAASTSSNSSSASCGAPSCGSGFG
jgi:putative FmdB family regulatory protein